MTNPKLQYLVTLPETVYHYGYVQASSEEEALDKVTEDNKIWDYLQEKDGGFWGEIELECRGLVDAPGQMHIDFADNGYAYTAG